MKFEIGDIVQYGDFTGKENLEEIIDINENDEILGRNVFDGREEPVYADACLYKLIKRKIKNEWLGGKRCLNLNSK